MTTPAAFETYLVTQESLAAGRTTSEVVDAALEGGVDAVQVREKGTSAANQLAVARELRGPTADAGVALLVNDRLDVALAADADGVHVGDDDLPVAAARAQFPDGIIGRSVSTVAAAQAAEADGADYLGVGAVYATDSKEMAAENNGIGLETVAAIADSVSIPIVGIGGVTPARAAAVTAAGADGVAVISAITAADDPEAATRRLTEAVRAGTRRAETPGAVELGESLAAVRETTPLVTAITNAVTVNDVAQTINHLGGLPVMSDDEREVAAMIAGADACLLNMGTVSEVGEATMLTAGRAANDTDTPVVVDPVGVGATPTRDTVADRLLSELNVAVVKGNYGEITALAGDDATVRGVESVGEYDEIAETALACAQAYDTVVVASGETDVVATDHAAYELSAGAPAMGEFVGTGCMLGGAVATVAGAVDDPLEAALAGTLAIGVAGEAAADGAFGDVAGPGSFAVAFRDAIAALPFDHALGCRTEQVLTAQQE